jgi:hypothetical protein
LKIRLSTRKQTREVSDALHAQDIAMSEVTPRSELTIEILSFCNNFVKIALLWQLTMALR